MSKKLRKPTQNKIEEFIDFINEGYEKALCCFNNPYYFKNGQSMQLFGTKIAKK